MIFRSFLGKGGFDHVSCLVNKILPAPPFRLCAGHEFVSGFFPRPTSGVPPFRVDVRPVVERGDDGGGAVVGVNNNTDFLRAIGSGTVYGTATPVHRGRRQQLWLVTITDADDRVVARGQVRLQNLES